MPPSNEKQRAQRKAPPADWTAPGEAPPSADRAKQRIEARFDMAAEPARLVGEEGDAGFDAQYERERRLANAEADLDAAPDDEASYRAHLAPPRRH